MPNSPPLPRSTTSPPYIFVISVISPSGSMATIWYPFLIWLLNNSFAAVDLPLPDVPKIIMLALFLLFSFFNWYKNWLNRITPPEKSTPSNVDKPVSFILSKMNGYMAAIVGDGIGVPIRISIGWASNIGNIDFNTLSCSNFNGIALNSIASK